MKGSGNGRWKGDGKITVEVLLDLDCVKLAREGLVKAGVHAYRTYTSNGEPSV